MYAQQAPMSPYQRRIQEFKKPIATAPRITMDRICNWCGNEFVSVKADGAWRRTCTPCKTCSKRNAAAMVA